MKSLTKQNQTINYQIVDPRLQDIKPSKAYGQNARDSRHKVAVWEDPQALVHADVPQAHRRVHARAQQELRVLGPGQLQDVRGVPLERPIRHVSEPKARAPAVGAVPARPAAVLGVAVADDVIVVAARGGHELVKVAVRLGEREKLGERCFGQQMSLFLRSHPGHSWGFC